MRQSTRLIVNTGATYCRMILTVGIGLGVTRLLVRTMGNDDYGLLTLLGGAGGMLLIITGALNVSSQRYLAFEIGRKDDERTRIVFNTALGLYLSVALVVAMLGVVLAPFLHLLLKIPPGRENAAFWVFQLTVFGLAITFASTPFRTLFAAHQELVFSAVLDIFDTLAKLAAAIGLLFLQGDHLIIYAALLLIANGVAQLTGILICFARYPESRPDWRRFHKGELLPMAGLAGWTLFNTIAYYLAMQSSDVLLNLFFGAAMLTAINAAYALAMQICSYQNSLGLVINRVVAPALIAAEGRGDRANVRFLAMVSGKWCVMLSLFYMVPLQLETHYLLTTWIGRNRELPQFSEIFVRLSSIWMCLGMVGSGLILVLQALGRFAAYTITTSILLFLTLAGSVVVFALGGPPWSLSVCMIVGGVVIIGYTAVHVGNLIDLPLGEWLRRAIQPVVVVGLIGFAVGGSIHYALPEGLIRLLAVGLSAALVMAGMIWLLALDPAERELLVRTGRNVRGRLGI